MERVRALLLEGNLPKQLWAECLCHVTTLLNMTPSSTTQARTPYKLWNDRIPSMHYLNVFGCAVYVHIHARYRDELDPRAKLCMYVGIPSQKKGYRLLDLDTHTVVYSRDVTFDETTFPKLENLASPPDTSALPYPARWPVSTPSAPTPLQSPVPHPVLPSVGDLFRQD
ncbi:TPA: hypothetical protein N0F65_010674 [Lagenidium giganteum]|uniref:Retroviral polymerase SH3-like domain-containing protein n=1 Tax=Lagenidium giganteum TaxID=4803 RepID=A0AAV2Z8X2_9STRA|nr:TPA: hypothetical protein N0F65_010674 [Lagenidium giganteum]